MMNSNTLRIRGSVNKNTRGSITFDPVVLPDNYKCESNEFCNKFIESNAENQLGILKQILNNLKENCHHDTVKFLVITYLNADAKHPAKCMISRYITKNSFIQDQFSEILTQEIESLINKHHTGPKSYLDAVGKLGSCTENFPTGAGAVKSLEILLAGYFKECLSCCISTLSEIQPLSPTEKNEIFNLAHSTLRLLLYLVQRMSNDNIVKMTSMFKDIRVSLKHLLFDDDAPMDTKSVCGILQVYMIVMENGSDSWIQILDAKQNSCDLRDVLNNESAKLSLYSAIATVIPMPQLYCQPVNGVPAIVTLTNNILDIGERGSVESTLVLGATRTLLQICKGLADATGLRLLDGLFVFVCSHLEHHTDSVQHLTAQALGYIIKYCAKLQKDGNEEAMNKLFTTLTALDRSRKSFYVSLTSLTSELGAGCIMEKWPDIVVELMSVLSVQAVQASATTALETLLRKHVMKCSSDVTHECWLQPIVEHVAKHALHSAELNILENLLSLAAKLDHGLMNYILAYVKDVCERDPLETYRDVKCVLMLLGVVRKSGELVQLATASREDHWKDIISYEVLKMAAVDSSQENRTLAISLVVESPKSTEIFARGELEFVLWFIKYNMNAQTPHFRQLVLSAMKKFVKRLENSYKVLTRESDPTAQHDKGEYYIRFVEQLRDLCFDGLVAGANFSRRHVALQILVWLENVQLDRYDRSWKEDEVEILLKHLGDSYEINKGLALELLNRCPAEILKVKKYTTSLDLQDILMEASSVKPTDCVTAVYKLKLLRSQLPGHIAQGEDSTIPNKVKFALLNTLLEEVQRQLAMCQQSIVYGAKHAPMYGILHCIGFALEPISPFGIEAAKLSEVMQLVVKTCVEVCACASAVLASAAPEGLLPNSDTSHSAGGYVRLDDGGEVSAQMVLLCAWRSVKEVSLILSTTVTQVLSYDEFEPPALRYSLVKCIGEQFTSLLTETKHRGAFEQVYVGFSRLLTSLWRSPNPEFNELPKIWLTELMSAIESGDSNGKLCATRRSAGLPFMIQALVITELQVKVNTRSFDSCMSALLRLARRSGSLDTRCHCLNILRALYRNSQLDETVGAYVGEGLLVALLGFESGTWIERNSATLLFSALMVRIFGVQRSKDSDNLCVRNRMTGRIFFLRYPLLYDFMIGKLSEVSDAGNGEEQLRPSLYPILLLLARLYPSSLEGTVSNLKLATFIPLVAACAGAAALHTRRLAANAAPPLVPPDLYLSHVEGMLKSLSDEHIKRNLCHGILLQLLKLLDARPENLTIDHDTQEHLKTLLKQTPWILRQCSADAACYVIADEYIKIVNVLMRRFDSLIDETFVAEVQKYLNDLIFHTGGGKATPGRELCSANAAYLYFITLNVYNKTDETCHLIYKCLSHESYEVVLTVLNYLLILNRQLDIENQFQEHLCEISKKNILNILRADSKYIETLCDILKSSKYLECTQKCLRLVASEPDTQKCIIKAKEENVQISDDIVMDKLFDYIENEHENLSHIFLASLCDFLTRKIEKSQLQGVRILEALRIVFACSLSDNSDDTRTVVVEFLENNLNHLLNLNLALAEEEYFELKATLWATVVTLLEDDDETLRMRSSLAITCLSAPHHPHVIPSRAADFLLEFVQNNEKHALAMLTLIALLDFKAEVCMNDEINDECRVFDQNERYNINLEETVWTRACADRIAQLCITNNTNGSIYSVISEATYRRTFEKLCGENFTAYGKLIEDRENVQTEINSKISIFYNKFNN